jgi:hypothetical protein
MTRKHKLCRCYFFFNFLKDFSEPVVLQIMPLTASFRLGCMLTTNLIATLCTHTGS